MTDRPEPRRVTPATSPAPFPAVYFDTVFLVPLPPDVPPDAATGCWPNPFAIVTAHNPEGEPATERANRESEGALADYLRAEGIESFAVIGASRDLTHHESGRGFAADSLAAAAAISARFHQRAFFWVEDGVIFVCIDDCGSGWEVARWEDRLVPMRR